MSDGGRDPEVQARFKQLDLHDSQLLGLQLGRRNGERVDDLHLSLGLLAGRYPNWEFQGARLTFLDCTYLKVDVDLGFKNVADDAISSAECLDDSSLRAELEKGVMENETNPLAAYWEFVVYLCPPGGRLHVFARDFRLDRPSL